MTNTIYLKNRPRLSTPLQQTMSRRTKLENTNKKYSNQTPTKIINNDIVISN
mgnify:CR=1 FL=1